ncbi:V-type proton ATPase subunit C [Histomonas meleagridis]|uniref:V-type proton ATPase subunit C n=1 Tax=Histomonas meleagridis TaxID=135588 RepID=UPI00355A4B25|nr:V-type proton ATPase subunit C [Histomonas meleagridis]KAH0801182.1 V-type proton ATPase subunit C [Histomonas meleagridis]
MAQYLLLSFSKELPPQFKGSSINKVIEGIVGSLGKVQQFPVSANLTEFSSTDQLMSIADEIGKLDLQAFSLLTRVARSCSDLSKKIEADNLRGWNDLPCNCAFDPAIPPKLLVSIQNGNQIDEIPIDQYIEGWEWNDIQFSQKGSVIEIHKALLDEVQSLDEQIRNSSTAFTEAGNKIINLRRRSEGSLLVRNLDEIGSEMYSVTNLNEYYASKATKTPIYVHTRNLSTILIVVKNGYIAEFKNNYTLDSTYVVPGSLAELASDNEYTCFAVTIISKNLDDYKSATKEKGWHIKEFTYNPNLREELQKEAQEAIQNYLNESNNYSEQLQSTFSQLAIVWLHIKAIRIFVESILLYGIKSEFQAFRVCALPKNIPKIHKELEKVFSDGILDGDDGGEDMMNDETEYHPYVSFKLNLVGLK